MENLKNDIKGLEFGQLIHTLCFLGMCVVFGVAMRYQGKAHMKLQKQMIHYIQVHGEVHDQLHPGSRKPKCINCSIEKKKVK